MPMMLDEHLDHLTGGISAMDDDLFGDDVLPMPAVTPSKQLQQRVDELRSRGCCRGIAYSKHGIIASIAPDGTHVDLQCPRARASDGSWELSEPIQCSILRPPLPGGPIVHLAWAPTLQPELAVVDAFGRVSILAIPVNLNKATFVTRSWDNDPQDDLHSVVGSYWLPLCPPRAINVGYGPAVKEGEKYQYGNNITQAFGPWHPNQSKSSLVCVTASGLLKLFYSQNSNQIQQIETEIESITSSDDLISHAAICSDRGKLLIVIATVAKQLKVVLAEINWGLPLPQQEKKIPPGSLPLKPSLKIEHIATTNWPQQGAAGCNLDASMDQISHLETLPPIVDARTKVLTATTMILAVRLHVSTPQSHFHVDYQSIIDRWEVVMNQPHQLHSAFEQRGLRARPSSSPLSMTVLRRLDPIVINKAIVSIETTNHGRLLCVGFGDGTVHYRDRVTFNETHPDDYQTHISILQQVGFHFRDEKPSLQSSFSANNCAFAQICENGKVKWNFLHSAVAEMGSTRADPVYDATLSGVTMVAANATHQYTNHDDILSAMRPFIEKYPKFLTDMVSTLVFMLSINIDYSEEQPQQDQVVRNLQLNLVMSILNHFGFRGEFNPRLFHGKLTALGLDARNVVILVTLAMNSPMSPILKEKVSPLDDPDVVQMLAGCAKWSIDLMCWLTDSLFGLRDDPKFTELIQTPRQFNEMTNYLKSKNDVCLHLILASSTRCILTFICRRILNLHAIADKAMSFWETRLPSNTSNGTTSNNNALHKAYNRLQRSTASNLIKVEEIEKLLTTLGAEVRHTYHSTLANFHQKAQQTQFQRPGQPNAGHQAVKKAQAHCELAILLGDQPPMSFQALLHRFFEKELPAIMGSTNRAELFFREFPLLGIEDDVMRLAKRKAEGRYVDVFRKVEHRVPQLGKGQAIGAWGMTKAFRRCVRCCSMMEDVVATRPGHNLLISQQRKCSCGGSWALVS